MPVKTEVRNFILRNYLFSENPKDLNDDESLIERGVIDSTGVLELVAFLEAEFAVRVADEEMVPENLDTVTAIVSFVDHKRSSLASQRAV